MGVDYSSNVVYGFQLDRKKVVEFFLEQKRKNPDFNAYEFMYEVEYNSNCMMDYDSAYCALEDCNFYFGVVIDNRINSQILAEIERDRRDDVCDTLIEIFGSYDILGDTDYFEPEVFVYTRVC